MKVNSLFFTILQRIPVIFFHKKLRHSHTEPVDTLLHISYHKNILTSVYPARHHCGEKFLYTVTVLIFVHHNFLITLGQFSGSLGRFQNISLFLHQDLQCQMLHIHKIQDILFSLFCSESFCKFCGQLHQTFQRFPAAVKKY